MEPVFDLDAVMARLGNDRGLFQDLVGFFFEDSPRILDQARAAAHDRNADRLMRSAHALKGIASNFSAAAAIRAAAQVEQRAIQGDVQAAAAAVPALEEELQRLQEALRPHRRSAD